MMQNRFRKIGWGAGLTALLVALAFAAASCGGLSSSSKSRSGGGTITVNWGTDRLRSTQAWRPTRRRPTSSRTSWTRWSSSARRPEADSEPRPELDESDGGKTVTFKLRSDGRWTNGDPVTANDFEYSWKRTISPELAADYAYQFFGIVGAQEYNSLQVQLRRAARQGRREGDRPHTLQVKLTSAQPWFVQQVAHTSFLAVNKKAVEQFGDKWTEAKNIVTDGPFKLAHWQHDSRIDLVKNPDWRNANEVSLERVNGRMISDGTTAVQAFEAGEVDVDRPRCRRTSSRV